MSGFLDDLPSLGTPGDDRPRSRRKVHNRDFVPYMRPRCPACGSARCPVYDSNHIPIRYYHCQHCGKTFKSVEVNYSCRDNDQ